MGKTVAVIGAGLGGLAAAIRLASVGLKVKVFEKNNLPGGKMSEQEWSGFRFDTGPSLLTMPSVLDELFGFCQRKRENYLHLIKIDPTCRYFFDDGSTLDTFANVEKMITILEDESADQIEAYKEFLSYITRLYTYSAEIFLHTPIHEFRALVEKLTLKKLLNIGRLDAFSTVHRRLTKIFKDPRLIQIFDRFTTYNGSDPFQAPATLNLIAHVELNQGAYYIQGGMYRLVDALIDICRETGIEINCDASVEQILYHQNRCKGVQVNGEMIETDYVVCNADVVHSYNDLIKGFKSRKKKLNKLEPSLSGMVLLWGVKGEFKQLSHHNIIFSKDYKLEFQQLFDQKTAPDDPTVYIAITSRRNRDHAPEGHENWFVLLNMPYLSIEQNWPDLVTRMRRIIIDKLARRGIDLSKSIVKEKILTPQDFERLYGANRGSIYGISSNSLLSAFLRPPNRSRDLKNLYFVGGATHPGGGIPLVLLSAKLVAEMISKKEKINR
jgi:phytoene desaturase